MGKLWRGLAGIGDCLGGAAGIGAWVFADRTVSVFPLAITYTVQKSGAAFIKHDGTSGFLNFLQIQRNRALPIRMICRISSGNREREREEYRPGDRIPIGGTDNNVADVVGIDVIGKGL